MEIFIAGKGNIASAFKLAFEKNKILFREVDSRKFYPPENGILFLAVTDNASELFIEKYYADIPEELKIVVFSPEVFHKRKNMFLLHPYSSVKKESEISSIPFTFWGDSDAAVFNFLMKLNLKIIKKSGEPSPAYHISAVFCGNFSQFLVLTAKELLKTDHFTEEESAFLIQNLIKSSSENILKNGINGFTGPAARKDNETIKSELKFLKKNYPYLSDLYSEINKKIMELINNGNLF